jgi:signal transduction histidine kinase
MLLWSKGQMENFKPQVKQIAINEIYDYLQKFFANADNVKFSFDNKDNLNVSTDEDYLKTIMQNLTNNAIKALKSSPNGTIHWKAEQQNG